VRLTVRTAANYLPTSLMAAIHEGGHALYEQGSSPALARTPLAGGASLGAHESQSRLWENVIGRSVPFWRHYFPIVRQTFRGRFRGVDPATFARALNRVAPSLIRVEADEVTYNLHIIVRFELESALLAGRLEVEQLPAAWNALYREYLGVAPENDAVGVLQDVHWSWGGLGYFPTYSLGNLYAAQIDAALRRAFPDLDRRLAREGSAFLLAWLRERMYALGAVYETPVLMERLTGERLNVDHFARYLTEKYAWVYELPPREDVPGV
jgi:carboxypeptidase Taq